MTAFLSNVSPERKHLTDALPYVSSKTRNHCSKKKAESSKTKNQCSKMKAERNTALSIDFPEGSFYELRLLLPLYLNVGHIYVHKFSALVVVNVHE